ncbi:MAG TPA: glycosyltransferase [Burkholderiaceae bacterium]
MSRPRLALVVIARDEARAIGRCLDSARPFVDDMIVLDTGSLDATAAIAADHGARVHHYTWCDDFSAARNAALDHSDADWNLLLDADEWLAAGGAELAALPAAGGLLGQIAVISSFDLGGVTESAVNWISRVLPRGVRYTGRIHEQPDSTLPRRRLALEVGHDGYRDAQLAGKRGRNRALLEKELADHPGDPYLAYQLAKDHEIHGRYGEASALFAEARQHVPEAAPYRHDLIVRLLFALKKAGRLDDAVALAELEMPHYGDSPDFYFCLGDVLLDCALRDPEQADAVLGMAMEAWERCLEIGERPELEGAVAGRGSHLAAHNLAVVLQELGQLERAAQYRALAARR